MTYNNLYHSLESQTCSDDYRGAELSSRILSLSLGQLAK